MSRMKKVLISLLVIFIVIIVVTEIGLRQIGFTQSPLYISDENYGYALAPNQNVERLGNQIITNEYSMRSLPLKDSDNKRILVIGDSVINGGNPTNQNDLATTKLEKKLSKKFSANIRVLNVSSGSWSIDNAAGYIDKYGDFDADLMVLVFNSHDAFDTFKDGDMVGEDPNFPRKQYFLALTELTDRYLIPRATTALGLNSQPVTNETKKLNVPNPGWGFFFKYSKEKNIPILILLHPDVSEVEENEYSEGGQWIIEQLEKNNIPLIKELDYRPSLENYRDNIHPDENGQKDISEILYPVLKDFVETGTISSAD